MIEKKHPYILTHQEINAVWDEPRNDVLIEGLSDPERRLLGFALDAYALQILANEEDFQKIGVGLGALKDEFKNILRLQLRLDTYNVL